MKGDLSGFSLNVNCGVGSLVEMFFVFFFCNPADKPTNQPRSWVAKWEEPQCPNFFCYQDCSIMQSFFHFENVVQVILKLSDFSFFNTSYKLFFCFVFFLHVNGFKSVPGYDIIYMKSLCWADRLFLKLHFLPFLVTLGCWTCCKHFFSQHFISLWSFYGKHFSNKKKRKDLCPMFTFLLDDFVLQHSADTYAK